MPDEKDVNYIIILNYRQ